MLIRRVALQKSLKSLLLLILLPTSMLFTLEAQKTQLKVLELQKMISDSLPQKTTHTYTLDLKADQFIRGYVNQISVDVKIEIKGPDNENIETWSHHPNGMERFHFESKNPGIYQIEISPNNELSGDYIIEIIQLEDIAKEPRKRVDQLVAPWVNNDGPGAVIAIVENGEITYSKAYGMANLTWSIPFTTETRNNIGSTSKQFTAFGITLLAKQGKLSLDDDVRDYLPELKDFGKKISIRNLLTHTSGYREFLNLLSLQGRNLSAGDYIDRDELVQIVQNQPELQNDPGAKWNYNNTGYALLAQIVEKVTEQPFEDWMADNVFSPLEMDNTIVRTRPWQIIPNSAQGYKGDSKLHIREGNDLFAAMGAGGIYTTVGDLTKWISNFKTAKVGGEDIINQMTTRFVLSSGDTTEYGLGLFIDKHKGLMRIHHGGADNAHRSMLAYYPDIDAAVILQSNLNYFPLNIASEAAELFFGEYMDLEKNKAAETTESSAFDPADYAPSRFDEFVGRYELEEMSGFILTFSREEDKFFTQATGQSKLEIVPTSDSTFKLIGVEASITFHRNDENKANSLTLHQNGNHLAKRLHDEPWNPSQEMLATYTGRYFSEEIQTVYNLAVQDSNLVVQYRGINELKLIPSKKDVFTGSFPINELVFVRNNEGEIIHFEVGNLRTQGVIFDRQK